MGDRRAGQPPIPVELRHGCPTVAKTGEEIVPRQAATVILLRGGAETLEVLLVQRTHAARFMGGVWVFPGGAVDAHEGAGDEGHRRAAVRELEEEAAVGGVLPGDLVKFSRWITPREVSVRFDTHFFLSPAPDGIEPAVDGDECIDVGVVHPGARAGGLRPRSAAARLPDDQAPAAVRRLRLRRRVAGPCARAGGPARAPAGGRGGRARPHPAAGGARLRGGDVTWGPATTAA
ncbi:MAG: NUDIX domain-containing protein [Actinomycetota bacterium]|nr:NUDIX domain-containing protein [Actinomycetota bacterium]